MNIEQRLVQLEKENRRLKIIGLLLSIMIFVGLAFVYISQMRFEQQLESGATSWRFDKIYASAITTQSIRVQKAGTQAFGVFEVQSDDPWLYMVNRDGKHIITIWTYPSSDGSEIQLGDSPRSLPRLRISTVNDDRITPSIEGVNGSNRVIWHIP